MITEPLSSIGHLAPTPLLQLSGIMSQYERFGNIGTSDITQKQKTIYTDYSDLNPFSIISYLNSKQYINQSETCLLMKE
jgi:hypothetical protein